MSTRDRPSTPEFAYAPAPAGRRGLGALVARRLALIAPVLALLLVFVAVRAHRRRRRGSDGHRLGRISRVMAILGAYVALVLGFILGGTALGLGIAVARRIAVADWASRAS